MTALRSFAAAFCTVCIMTGGLQLLCPAGRTEKAVRYAFGLIFILCVLSAVPGVKSAVNSDFQLPQTENAAVSAPSVTKAVFETALRQADIPFSQIELCTDNSAADGINITKVTVFTSADASTVRRVLGGGDAPYEIEVVG
ncbi:MAG: hypothetical protein MJ132_00985 [Clostridia bacterium]|nr:hypothetical protein [Clostridia bacterium]